MAMNDEIKMSELESEAVNRKRNRDRILCPPRNRFGNAIRKPKLYVCFQEVNYNTSCYFIRAIDLDALMSCSCDFNHETGQETKCDMGVNHDDDLRRVGLLCGQDYDVPNAMGCCPFGSQVVFVGGELAPYTHDSKPSFKVYGFDIKNDDGDGLDDVHETNVMSIKELDKASNRVANIDHAVYNSRMMEINGDLYALALNKYEMHSSMGNSLVYREQSQRWEVLPAPMPPPGDHDYFDDTNFSLLVTANRIFLSMQFPFKMPVRCFDTDKKCWIDSIPEFPFPFFGQGLAVDLDTPTEKLVFAHGFHNILVWRLRLTDDLNVVSDIKRLETLNLNPKLLGQYNERRLINLGDGKICLVIVKRLNDGEDADRFEKEYVIITVFRYEFDPAAERLSYKFLRTRTFSFRPHCIDCEFIRLLNCFVC